MYISVYFKHLLVSDDVIVISHKFSEDKVKVSKILPQIELMLNFWHKFLLNEKKLLNRFFLQRVLWKKNSIFLKNSFVENNIKNNNI